MRGVRGGAAGRPGPAAAGRPGPAAGRRPPPAGRSPPPAAAGREVHVVATSAAISQFVDSDRATIVCRCGQVGHLRYQCLSAKVRLCWHHQNGRCDDAGCTYAHGEAELRTPWKPRCVRVVKHGGELVCIGCNSTEHTFRRCPLHQNLLLL